MPKYNNTELLPQSLQPRCSDLLLSHSCVHRDQPGDGGKSGGYCQHSAIPPDAQILEGKAPGFKETGRKQKQSDLIEKKINLFFFCFVHPVENHFVQLVAGWLTFKF